MLSAFGVLVACAAVLALACGKQGTQRVDPELQPPSGVQDFGVVPVLNKKLLPIPIVNVGRANLELLKVSLKDDGAGAFVITTMPPAEVEASATVKVVVTFTPKQEQDYTGILLLETNDDDHKVVEVSLAGKGSTRAVMVVDPMVLDFGRVPECTAAVKTFTITSNGTADLIVEELGFTPSTPATFAFVGSSKTPATVKNKDANGLPGKIQLTVKFTAVPGASGMVTGGIHIKGTDPDNPEMVLMLKAEINRAPVAVIAPLGNGAPGLTIALDGSGSSDPDADDPLVYKWTMRSKPLSSDTTIAAPAAAVTSIRLDPQVPGAYELQLDVTDATGVKNCQSARATVVATPAQKLLVEMFWDHQKTDLDLHLLRTPSSKVGMAPDDCFYANPKPDWGQSGATDDPAFLRDALTGYGPELFGYVNPVDTTYRVVVEFANEHLDPDPVSRVTIRIYLYGVVKGEFNHLLEKAGNRWVVGDIAWPSGVITPAP